jgi:SAM-dependent methyltransferase
VLELGAGSGRMLSELAHPSREVWGLELDAGLLALGRRALSRVAADMRPRLVRGNMEEIRLKRRFERVLLPYNAFYCLLGPRAARRCLRAVHAVLEPGGVFAFDVWNAEPIATAGLSATDEVQRLRVEDDGQGWAVFEDCRIAPGSQRLNVTYRYVSERNAAIREQVIRQRYYRISELLALLTETGFSVEKLAGGFAGGRFTPDSSRIVISAARV